MPLPAQRAQPRWNRSTRARSQAAPTAMAPEFPCKQHSDFKSAAQRRKHVNLLLLDGCDEFERTYGPDGRPRQPLVLPLQPRKTRGPAPTVPDSVKHTTQACETARQWTTAYEEGGQEAADVAKQVGSSRTPIGTFFGLVNPGVARQDPTNGLMPNTHRELLCKVRRDSKLTCSHQQGPYCQGPATYLLLSCYSQPAVPCLLQDALATMGRLQQVSARPGELTTGDGAAVPVVHDAKACRSGHVGSAVSTQEERKTRSWLMPHQTQDAAAGVRMARAVNSKRTPIGGFAVFDLAKAPK